MDVIITVHAHVAETQSYQRVFVEVFDVIESPKHRFLGCDLIAKALDDFLIPRGAICARRRQPSDLGKALFDRGTALFQVLEG